MTAMKKPQVFLLIILLRLTLLASTETIAQSETTLAQAPTFTLSDLHGNQVSSDPYRGSY